MRSPHHLGRSASLCALASLAFAAPAAAHPHVVSVAHQGAGQVIANAQNHGPYVNGVSCGGDPAGYGLEAAHHGPDGGTPGRADGCYSTTDGVPPAADVSRPVIR
jgi:hypothetical protein